MGPRPKLRGNAGVSWLVLLVGTRRQPDKPRTSAVGVPLFVGLGPSTAVVLLFSKSCGTRLVVGIRTGLSGCDLPHKLMCSDLPPGREGRRRRPLRTRERGARGARGARRTVSVGLRCTAAAAAVSAGAPCGAAWTAVPLAVVPINAINAIITTLATAMMPIGAPSQT